MQVCCGSEERLTFIEEMTDIFPECATENMEGKTKIAGYTACL